MNKKPKMLILDIETKPIIAHIWSIHGEQNVGINQIQEDWSIIAWSAKWFGSKKIMYADVRHEKNVSDDKKILKQIWQLMDEADIIITKNGARFDLKKLNTRFILNGFNPPSPYEHIDTEKLARRKFGFTSNKLEYLASQLDLKFKKLKHKTYPGHELWSECLKGNFKAWKEMERYNKYDVLSTEQLYLKLRSWDNSVNLGSYSIKEYPLCPSCGSHKIYSCGEKVVSKVRKVKRYRCEECYSYAYGKINLFSKEKRAVLLKSA